jgi:RHS repeat-associated protein
VSRRAWFGSISVVICVALAATMAPAMAASGRPAAFASDASTQAKVGERPDRVSAMVTAQAQKSRVEDLSARTPTTATYANPDGTWTTESYSGVVRSKVDADTWVPVDPSVEKEDGGYAPKATPFDAQFSDGGDKTIGSATTPSDATITVGWPTKLPAPQVDGNQLTYTDAAAGSDLVVTSYGDGFDYSVVLDHAPAADAPALEYRIPLSFGGATPVIKADGSIVVKDAKNRVATMSAPVMWDSSQPGDDGQVARQPVTASVEGTGDTRTLVLKPDMDYLRDPARTFPVTMDPNVTLNAASDTWAGSLLSQSGQSASPELQVGSNNLGIQKTRSFLYFDFTQMPAMAPSVLTHAEVQLSDFVTGACTGTAVRMSRITGPWSPTGLTWSNQPAVTATGSSTSTGSFGASACPAEGTVAFDATNIVSYWSANAGTNYGVQLAADNESVSSGYRKFRSVENGDLTKVPKLVMTFNAYPSTATGLTISPGYNGYASSLTPTLSAVVSDPDAGAVGGYFEVKSGSTVVWSGSSPMATSGARVSVTVPSGVLADGTTYTVAAYSQDASLKSQTAATKSMPIDVTAPTMTMSSSAFTDGVWSTTTPASATFTLNGSTGTGAFDTVFDGVPYGSVAADGSGNYVSQPWVPTPGWHTWQIAPIDLAGNRGATTTFSFGVGGGGFLTPHTWTETTSSFPVEMTAPPNATGATLQWQVNGESTWHNATQVTAAGSAWTGSVTTSSGHSATPTLVWKATGEPLGTGTLTAPRLLLIKGCFHYASAADSCTAANVVVLTTSARGGNFPEADLGPASVALYTGEATISDTDAADSQAGLGRTFSSFSDATLNTGVFGPGWSDPSVLTAPSADAKAEVVDNRTKDGTFAIVDPDSGSQVFTPKQGSTTGEYLPLQPTGDATKLTFTAGTNGDPDKLELLRPLGSGSVTTTWNLKASDTGGNPEWTFVKVDTPGTTAPVAVTSTALRPIWIRESDPGAAAACTATTQTTGCRGLQIAYTGTGTATRVASVSRVIGADTQAGVVTKTLATYTYDGTGKLTTVCSAVPAAGKPALCVGYTYTTVAGRTLLAQITPPGLKPWRFSYDSIARLTTVTREKPTGGDAVWSADYNLAVNASGLPDLGATAAVQWGQTVLPTKVFAVYAPFTGTADVTKAQLFYTTTNGTTTNTATYGPSGWLVDTNWYDAKGNTVRQLDGTGWARVQAAAAADRPRVADEASAYTVYNAWGRADVAGTRVVDEYGPAHTASLKNGTIGLYRTHTHTMYDDDPNVDPSLITATHGPDGLGLVVKTTDSVSDAARTSDYDSVVTKYGYEPIVSGDGNGWILGSPTTVSTQVDVTTWSTDTSRFDNSGREIESRQPGGSEDGSHAGNDAHSIVTTYYTASGSGDCGGKPAWDGLDCKVGPAAQPVGTSMPITYTTAYNEALQPTTVQEMSGGTVDRTTTTTYDNIGRVTGITKATSGSGVVSETIPIAYGFDDNTGLSTTTTDTANGKIITTAYDAWGRTTNYTDSLGSSAATTYDAAGNIDTFNDGSGTYVFTYDSHGRLSSVDAGAGAGSFAYSYTTAGDIDTVAYPNGVVAKRSYDQTGEQIGLSYSQGATELLGFSATLDAMGRTLSQASSASAKQFTYDDLGRLSKTQDTRSGGCTTRTYGFNASSDRTSFASYDPGSGGGCQATTAAVTTTSSYDTAGRPTNSGYTYDTLGRTLTTPQSDAGPNAAGALTSSYHANDMVASMSQNVSDGIGGTVTNTNAYSLDPADRISTVVQASAGSETSRLENRYDGMSDAPAAIRTSVDGGSSWTTTRYVNAPVIGMSETVTSGTSVVHLSDLHGDIVATMPGTSGATVIASYLDSDEFGRTTSSARYSWHGSQQRSADALGGMRLMGARVYNPTTGAFTSQDPVQGGNVTAYTYPQDPVNSSDLTGEITQIDHPQECTHDACVSLSRRCEQVRGFTRAHCSLLWWLTFRKEARLAYRVYLRWQLRINGSEVGGWRHYGHAEPGTYFFHSSWFSQDGGPRGYFTTGQLWWKDTHYMSPWSRVSIEFRGELKFLGDVNGYFYGYVEW